MKKPVLSLELDTVIGGSHAFGTCRLLGFDVLKGSRESMFGYISGRLSAGIKTHILTLNPEIVVYSSNSPEVSALLHKADLVVADGVGLTWAAGILAAEGVSRYPGIDLATDVLAYLDARGGSVYLLGSAPGVAERAALNLTDRFPGLNIAGSRDGFFLERETGEVVANIQSSKPDLLLVGMGSPRQEGFITFNRDELGVPLMIGVGGALEVFAGLKPRAPGVVRAAGLEWAYRSLQDINRFKRLGALPKFIWQVIRFKMEALA